MVGPGFRGPVVGRGVHVAGFRGGGGGFRRGWGGRSQVSVWAWDTTAILTTRRTTRTPASFGTATTGSTSGHLEKFLSPSRCESDSLTAGGAQAGGDSEIATEEFKAGRVRPARVRSSLGKLERTDWRFYNRPCCCRRLRRHYALEQVDLLGTVALLKPSPFGQHRWRLYRASHGHGPLPDSGRERI